MKGIKKSKKKKNEWFQPFHYGLHTILKDEIGRKKLMRKKKKKSESTGLTRQIRLTRQT
jgi:hypothetical protein